MYKSIFNNRFCLKTPNHLKIHYRMVQANANLRQVPNIPFFAPYYQSNKNFSIDLPVLNKLVNKKLEERRNNEAPLSEVAIFYVHHALQTSLSLVDAFMKLGARPNNIFVVGKSYSECPLVVNQFKALGVNYQPCSPQINIGNFSISFAQDINSLWSTFMNKVGSDISKLLILDHGGHALGSIPEMILNKYKVVGLEKTTGGLINLKVKDLPPCPIISVASCATKKVLESPLIANAVVSKLLPYVPIADLDLVYGIVGYGAIGKALANKLLSMGRMVVIYDSDHNQLEELEAIKSKIFITNELSAVFATADIIFGCTGRDITASDIELFRLARKDKTLISCSSEDNEFLSLLKIIVKRAKDENQYGTSQFDNLIFKTDLNAKIQILRGGFPINFDNSGESVPAKDIQLTRALVLGGVLQAVEFFSKPRVLSKSGIYALNSSLQKFIVDAWLKENPEYSEMNNITKFQDKDWITRQTDSIQEPCDYLDELFELDNKVTLSQC